MIEKHKIMTFILRKNPFFFRFNIGDKVVFKHACELYTKEGVIEERGFTFNYSYWVIPQYVIRYKEGSLGTYRVEEEDIKRMTKDKEFIKKFKEYTEEIEKRKLEIMDFKKKIDKLDMI